MSEFVELLKSYEDYMDLGGVSSSIIEEAEKELSVKFALEYKEYLERCGTATANGHELTGICSSKRLNVVEVTKKALQFVELENAYVIENANIDCVLVWQNTNGDIFRTQGDIVVKVCDSLSKYIVM